MMKYLPFENINYRTKLSEDEILKRVQQLVATHKQQVGSRNSQQYKGSLSGNTFKIKRIIHYKNSFLPRINGRIGTDDKDTIIQVKMRVQNFVMVFMSIWMALVGIACIISFAFICGSEHFELATVIPFVMFIFGYALLIGAFKNESNPSKKYLAQLFEAEIK